MMRNFPLFSFETQTLKDTYNRIKKNEYHVPSRVGPLAKNLIQKLLQHEPNKRPSVAEILQVRIKSGI